MRRIVHLLVVLRLTRFVTTDWLGEWLIGGPANRWADGYENTAIARRPGGRDGHGQVRTAGGSILYEETPPYDPDFPLTWQKKMVKGLDCPFCVGFWIGLIVLVAAAPATRLPVVGRLLDRVLQALALNYVAGHVASRLDG